MQPRASRTEVVGLHGDAVKIRISAPPVDGAANREIVTFVATVLGVAKRDVSIVRGSTGRKKSIAVAGWSDERVVERLLSERVDTRG